MCWSETVSWTTLAIGTLFNIVAMISIPDPTFIAISIIWQWILLMQLFDALGWHGECGSTVNKVGTYGAMIANLTQPLIVLVMLLTVSKVSVAFKCIAIGLFLIYAGYMIGMLHNKRYDCLKPQEDCTALRYSWWDDAPYGGALYTISIIGIILLLLRPFIYSLYQVGYILLALALSGIFYACGTASMWCWFAAFAPVFNGLAWKWLVE